MKVQNFTYLKIAVLTAALSVAACQNETRDDSNVAIPAEQTSVENAGYPVEGKTKQIEQTQSVRTTKIKPPINVDYKILGNPELGQPLEIELTVTSSIADMPVEVNYQALDKDAMQFMSTNNTSNSNISSSSGNQSFKLANANQPSNRKIIVVPQKQGRNIITVTTQIVTPQGPMATSTAIAIHVGDAPIEKKINGELSTDEEGEVVISMPAN